MKKIINQIESAGWVILIITAGFILSCGRGYAPQTVMHESAPAMQDRQLDTRVRSLAAEPAFFESPGPEGRWETSTGQDGKEIGERKLVRTGSMQLISENLEKAEIAVNEIAAAYGGYISSTSKTQEQLSLTIKIPTEGFGPFMDEAADLGVVRSKNVNTEDVTDRYYDLEHRIRGKEILVERYQNYLVEAVSIEDILTVEWELNKAITELERLKGSFRNLDHLVTYSTLHITVRLPSYAADTGPLPSIRAGLKTFGYTAAHIFYLLFFIILGVLLFGSAAVPVIGLLYWLGFGRIGLVRRFFKKLKPAGKGKQRLKEAQEVHK